MILQVIKRNCPQGLQPKVKIGNMYDFVDKTEKDGVAFCSCLDSEGNEVRINSKRFDYVMHKGNLKTLKNVRILLEMKRKKKEEQEKMVKALVDKVTNSPELKEMDLMIRLAEVLVVKKSEELCDKMAQDKVSMYKKHTRIIRESCKLMRNKWKFCDFDEGAYKKFSEAADRFIGMINPNLIKVWFSLNSWVKNVNYNYNEVRTDALIIMMLYSECRGLYFEFCKKLGMQSTPPEERFYEIYKQMNDIAGCLLQDYKNIESFVSVIHNEFLKTRFMYEDEAR